MPPMWGQTPTLVWDQTPKLVKLAKLGSDPDLHRVAASAAIALTHAIVLQKDSQRPPHHNGIFAPEVGWVVLLTNADHDKFIEVIEFLCGCVTVPHF